MSRARTVLLAHKTNTMLGRYQSRAFLLLPMCFNIGVIIGPILGGILSDPAGTYPSVFGSIGFLVKYPYATPNIVSAIFMMVATLGTWLFLEEVSLRILCQLLCEAGMLTRSADARCSCRYA